MIDLTFDNGTVENFTLVLSQRDYTHLGQISNVDHIKFKANLNSAQELSFDVYKELDGHKEILWDEIYDLRLVWIRELNEYFEIDVESTDKVSVVKNITAKSLCESELSQTGLHDIEINTADDIARPDYDVNYPTVFYRPLNGLDPESEEYKKKKNSSLLHRVMDKVPAYSIGHVDETLMNLQRIFSISDTTLYDFLTGECAEQFNCLFQFDSATRTLSAYDLQSTCHNPHCPYYEEKHVRYRGLFNDKCPICGSTDISSFGEDTTVFVSTENLTDEVKFDTDVASLKNCFRLEAGDDNMTAAVINSNPNGTRYIYEFNAEAKRDMPTELVELIDSYDELYEEYDNTKNMNLGFDPANPTGTENPSALGWYEDVDGEYVLTSDTSVVSGKAYYIFNQSLIDQYNAICNKYNNDQFYHKGTPWNPIVVPVLGYKNLIPHYYNGIDLYQYLKSSMMPPVVIEHETVHDQMVALINAFNNDNQIGLATTPTVATTVESAVTNVAKLYVNTGLVKVKAETTTWTTESTTWTGVIQLTSFEDDTDFERHSFTLNLTTDFAEFMDQKISKYLKRSKESMELYEILKIDDLDIFKTELKKYSAVRLQSFTDALAAVLGILVEAGQGSGVIKKIASPSGNPQSQGWYVKNSDGIYVLTTDTSVQLNVAYYSITNGNTTLYIDFYLLYHNKHVLAEKELNDRNKEIEIVNGIQDLNGNTTTKGVLQYIIDSIYKVQDALNFKQYIFNNVGSYELYNLYTTYIREDTYSNSNYISDDLNNDQLFENAGRFLDLARTELHKSATYQHSITSNLNNLIAIPEFKPLLNKFNLGNWIRIQEDERIYRLRLISYSIDFDNISKLDTEFSDVTITANGLNDVMSVLKQASSMASSYSYTQQQAESGSEAKTNYIDDWVANGLNSALVRINNNDDEDISIDNTGILARSYDDINDIHDPEQLRITHNVIAFTDDNWESVKTSLGKFSMTHHDVSDYYVDGMGINTDANDVTRYDEYGLVANAVLAGWVVGSYIEGGNIIASHIQKPGNHTYIDMGDNTTDAKVSYFIWHSLYNSSTGTETEKFSVTKDGKLKAMEATIIGDITAESGTIGGWTINKNYGIYTNSKTTATSTNAGILIQKDGKIYAGAYNSSLSHCPFQVDNNGNLYATSATITGTIHATAGDFGTNTTKVTIGNGCIYNGKSTIDYDSTGFYVGSSGISCGKIVSSSSGGWNVSAFKVTNAGALYATNANIKGTISGSTISGSTKLLMDASGSSYNTTLNWGDTWSDSLNVVIGDNLPGRRNNDAGLGVCLNSNRYNNAVYMHYNDIRLYYNDPNPLYAQWGPNQYSDRRLKENVKKLSSDILRVFFDKLEPISFNYKKEVGDKGTYFGVFAQDMEEALNAIGIKDSRIVYENKDGYKNISYSATTGLQIGAIKDLYEITNIQQNQINILQKEIKRLKGVNNE